MTRWVLYHSWEWAELVEQGWVTAWVDGQNACMLRMRP
jgi:hypothetical protein